MSEFAPSRPSRFALPHRRAIALVVATAVLVMTLATAPAGAATTPVSTAGLAGEFAAQLNAERAARGAPPLVLDGALTADAQAWSNEMSRSSTLHHSPDQVIEIVAYGYGTGQITDAWMSSPGHRHLVVDPNLGRAGIGVTCDASGRMWATVQFTRTNTRLGTLRSSSSAPRVTSESAGSDCTDQPVPNAVRRLYRAYFQRESDAGGLAFWVQTASSGVSLGRISNEFASSAEFAATYGRLSDRDFLDLVYRNVLQRRPDQDGYRYWLGQLRSGLSRGDLMLNFSDAAEFRNVTGLH